MKPHDNKESESNNLYKIHIPLIVFVISQNSRTNTSSDHINKLEIFFFCFVLYD